MTDGFVKCSLCSPRLCEEASLYVVFDPDRSASKIGMSSQPVKRYSQHRKKVGKHVELAGFVSAGCSFRTSRREVIALAEMESRFGRLNGDWFLAAKADALSVIARASIIEVGL